MTIYIRCSTIAIFSIIGLTSICVANPSYAVSISNSSFETGNFTNWKTIGDASIQTAAFDSDPTEGSYEALITARSDSSSNEIETFLGLEVGSLTALGHGYVENGSAIQQSFTARAGDIVSFSWNFLTPEGQNTAYNDFAFASLNSLTTLASVNTSSLVAFNGSDSIFTQQSEFQSSSLTIDTDGTYTLGLGVINVNDVNEEFASGLLVDNVSVKSAPEPSSILGTLALGVLGVWSLLRRKKISAR